MSYSSSPRLFFQNVKVSTTESDLVTGSQREFELDPIQPFYRLVLPVIWRQIAWPWIQRTPEFIEQNIALIT